MYKFRVLIVDHPWVDDEGFRHIPQDILSDFNFDDWAFLSDLDGLSKAYMAAAADAEEFEFYYYDGRDG